ncbi:MAG TPA: amidohydrolase family protein [Acidimicrobiales bacterium]|nr:amidohydrolase family protein [Acidimicrobiales bacterium]
MLDYVIRSGTLIDGTGAPARQADIGIRDGRVVVVGEVDEQGATELDATGLCVMPGVVDPHTHYDAQLFWDPTASPSNVHGVTTVIGGNCGFTLAPINAEDADYIRRMMAKVEGMPLAALEHGVPWSWSSFAEYLGALDGGLGVNAGFLVGHCALRRKVMGSARGEEVATDEEIAAMRALLAESIDAGGLGFSSSQSRTHSDGDGRPISSRYADRREMLAFSEEVGAHEGTTLEYITNGCLDSFSPDEIDLMTAMSVTAQRPLNWNVLTVDARAAERIEHQLSASSAAAAAGGRIVALTMPTLVPMNMSFRTHCALFLIPGWGDVMGLPEQERMAQLADPAVRAQLDERARSKEAGVFRGLSHWGTYVIGDTYAPANEGCAFRSVADIAAERGTAPFDTLLDIVLADDLRTVLWPNTDDGTEATWTMRAAIWSDPRAMVGGSDAGAHLDRMCGSNYPTAFLADCLRGRKLVPVEEAVRMMTSQPAELFGLRERGVVREGFAADLFVFDPETVDSEPARLVHDLPGETPRLYAGSHGVVRVLVNGVETVRDGAPTGSLPGTVLRSGRDTASVIPAPA